MRKFVTETMQVFGWVRFWLAVDRGFRKGRAS
jgi:hypothetical protein